MISVDSLGVRSDLKTVSVDRRSQLDTGMDAPEAGKSCRVTGWRQMHPSLLTAKQFRLELAADRSSRQLRMLPALLTRAATTKHK